MLAGQVHPGHGLLGAPLLVEEGAQVGVGVQVARQRLHRRPPVVAGVAFGKRRRLGHPRVHSHEGHDAGAPLPVQLDPVAALGEGEVFGELGDRPHRVRLAGAFVLRADGEQAASGPLRDLHRPQCGGGGGHQRERCLGEEADLAQGEDGEQEVARRRVARLHGARHGTTSAPRSAATICARAPTSGSAGRAPAAAPHNPRRRGRSARDRRPDA